MSEKKPDDNVLNISESLNNIVMQMIESFNESSGTVSTFGIVLLSISISMPIKGLIYVAWMAGSVILRILVLMAMSDGTEKPHEVEICRRHGLPGFLSKYDGGRNSIFMLSFALFYACFPMFISSNINWQMFVLLFMHVIFDSTIKFRNSCINSFSVLSGEIIAGSLCGLIASSAMFMTMAKHLFINNFASNNEVCSMPKKQSFKCSVYKNGEIVNSVIS